MATPQRTTQGGYFGGNPFDPNRKPMSKQLPALPKTYTASEWLEIVKTYSAHAFITGSQAFGTARVAMKDAELQGVSDTDIAVPISDKDRVRSALDILFNGACEPSEYNAGFKFETKHGALNIVPLHPLDFVCWKLTTEHIQRLVKFCPEVKDRIKDRTVKLGTFEILTGLHKQLIPYTGADETLDLLDQSDKTPY